MLILQWSIVLCGPVQNRMFQLGRCCLIFVTVRSESDIFRSSEIQRTDHQWLFRELSMHTNLPPTGDCDWVSGASACGTRVANNCGEADPADRSSDACSLSHQPWKPAGRAAAASRSAAPSIIYFIFMQPWKWSSPFIIHDACLKDVSNSIDLQQPAAKLARTRDQLTRRSTHRPVDLLAAAPLSADHANATHQPHMHAPTERIYYTFQPQHFSVSPISISVNRMII